MDIMNATNGCLTLGNAQLTDAGRYVLVASNSLGMVTSREVVLDILDGSPRIASSPSSQVVPLGYPVSFSVAADGVHPMDFQWFFQDQPAAGPTQATWFLGAARTEHNGSYRVQIRNEIGTAESDTATLTVVPVAAWGNNGSRQITLPPSLTNAVLVKAGNNHNIAMLSDGTLISWAGNGRDYSLAPAGLSNVVEYACGESHSVALIADGTVVVWGDNTRGQTNLPAGLTNIVAIAAHSDQSLALRHDGTVVGWGNNALGRLNIPAGLSNVVSIASGIFHNVALRADGSVVAWGNNAYGQTNVPSGLTNVVALASGSSTILVLKADGMLAAWGNNTYGQLNIPPGLSNVVAIASGPSHCLAVKSDGTVVCWGRNAYTQTDVPEYLTNVVAVSGGTDHSLAFIRDRSLPVAEMTSPTISGQSFTALLPTSRGRIYWLERKDSLRQVNWLPVAAVIGDGTTKQLADPTESTSQRFYRVRQY